MVGIDNAELLVRSGALINSEKILERRYKYSYSPDELQEIQEQLLQNMTEKTELEDEKKQVMSDYKYRIEIKELEVEQNHAKLSRKYEFRDKKVRVYLDFVNKRRILVDKETGEFFAEEKLEDSDYQLKIKLDADAEKAKNNEGGEIDGTFDQETGEITGDDAADYGPDV